MKYVSEFKGELTWALPCPFFCLLQHPTIFDRPHDWAKSFESLSPVVHTEHDDKKGGIVRSYDRPNVENHLAYWNSWSWAYRPKMERFSKLRIQRNAINCSSLHRESSLVVRQDWAMQWTGERAVLVFKQKLTAEVFLVELVSDSQSTRPSR